MTENEAIDKLNNLHYKIVHTSFCNKVYESEIEALCMAKDCLKEIQQYRAIGTVEDFKALKEKNTPKKPNKDEFDRFTCPDCGWIVSTEEYGGRFLPHCENCGQAIDWSE